MKVMKHNDDAIRMIDTFKKYNIEMTEILEDDNTFRTIKGADGKIFCGTFIAKVYVGTKPIGTYKFDCRHWVNILTLTGNQMKPKLSVVREYAKK
ncbi:MAG: hypothetical protein II502_00635 [Paludibacteraceae bacterium]|nr:hypothetical protein [Paludibacteraceae bacterium]